MASRSRLLKTHTSDTDKLSAHLVDVIVPALEADRSDIQTRPYDRPQPPQCEYPDHDVCETRKTSLLEPGYVPSSRLVDISSITNTCYSSTQAVVAHDVSPTSRHSSPLIWPRKPSGCPARMEVACSDIQTRPYDRPRPPLCEYPDHDVSETRGTPLLEPENMSLNQLVDISSITNTSYSSTQAEVVAHDVLPTSRHPSPLISARKPSGWPARMEVARSDIQTRPHDRPQPPQCVYPDHDVSATSETPLLEPENMSSNQLVDISSITKTSYSSTQAEVVAHDVSPTSRHSSPLISARKPSGWPARMEVARTDIQTRPYDRPQPPLCVYPDHDVSETRETPLLEPENMSSNQLVDISSITNTSYSSTQAEVVAHDVSPTSRHSSPLISARKPSGWPMEFFIRIDLEGSFHTYPCLGGPFRSLQEAENAIASHLDGLRSPIMCKDGLSRAEIQVRHRLYWPDGTRQKSSKSNPERTNTNLLVKASLDKYNEDHHLSGDLAYELNDVVSFRHIYEKEGRVLNRFYHINLSTKTKGGDGFHSGTDNLFFAEVTRIKGENEEYMLNCFCMVKPTDNGRCSGCTRYGQYDLKHPLDADKYKGGHSTPFGICGGVDIPVLDLDVHGYIHTEEDLLAAEEAMLAAEEARIRYIYKCPLDSPIPAKVDGARMPASLAKGGEGAGLAKRGEGAGLAKRGEGAGLVKREDGQRSLRYIVPARRPFLV